MPSIQTSDDIRIHYELRGEGPPLLLLMGLGADHTVWEEHAAEYEKHFQCVLIDNRGVGQSDKPGGSYSTARMATDAIEVAAELGIDSAHAAGISMGGAIVQEIALQKPDLLRSAVIIASWAKLDPYGVAVFEHFKPARAHMRNEDWMRMIQLWIFAAPFWREKGAALVQGRMDAAVQPNPQPNHGFEGQCDACITHDTLDRLGSIQTPSLVVVGEDDIFTPKHYSDTLHEALPNSELAVWPNAGHAVHWEVLEEFNARSRDFMLAH